ncbi:purine-binding chemotaxis protein CheW [Aestuariispira insulae]|uniref:Purine-binding chemotaxis protein CheW n=2 Tax=Aestuariispira insulae TaxID=1461337 RepID=A0A3D9HX55_9PROT|nr:purine-binding chemotaxis protein CheW [Aestuariispira insulae]
MSEASNTALAPQQPEQGIAKGGEGALEPTDLSGEMAQFVTFTIGKEEYGVDIMAVREIKGWSDTTQLPNTPEYMRGVLNLRGLIVPIFDLRCRFSGRFTEVTPLHVIIIVAVGDRMIGILVDTVSDILSITSSEIRAVPKMDRRIDDQYLTGLVNVKDRMVALLDVERLFRSQELNDGFAAAQSADN